MAKTKSKIDDPIAVTPPENEWVHNPEFEAKLYDPKAVMPEVRAILGFRRCQMDRGRRLCADVAPGHKTAKTG